MPNRLKTLISSLVIHSAVWLELVELLPIWSCSLGLLKGNNYCVVKQELAVCQPPPFPRVCQWVQ